jgi:hypothetical protein
MKSLEIITDQEDDSWELKSISSFSGSDTHTDTDAEVITFEKGPEEDIGAFFDSCNIDTAEDWNKFIKSYQVFSFFVNKYQIYHSDKGLLLKKKRIYSTRIK